MTALTRTISWPLRALASWTGENPFRAAGLLALVGGLLATLLSVGALTPTGFSPAALTAETLAGFAVSHPAYPAAVLAGGGLLLRP